MLVRASRRQRSERQQIATRTSSSPSNIASPSDTSTSDFGASIDLERCQDVVERADRVVSRLGCIVYGLGLPAAMISCSQASRPLRPDSPCSSS